MDMAPRKILAIKLRSLGDTVLMTAPLIELTRAFPHAEIHTLVTQSWAPILEGIPGIHRIWTYEKTSNRLKELARLTFALRKEGFDCVVGFHTSPSSARLALATGATCRALHFHGHREKNRYSTVEIPGKGILKPIIERDMDAIRALGAHVPAGRIPQVFLQESEIQSARNYLDQLGLHSPILALGLGASRPTKTWPLDRFAALALEWCQKEKNGGVIALAGASENHLIQEFLKNIDDRLTYSVTDQQRRAQIREKICSSSQLSVRKLAAVLSQVSVFAGNDSGPKHLAIAVGTPTVTIFGPEHPFEWHPYPRENHPYFFIENLPCRKDADPGMPPWCGIQICEKEEHRCMQSIGVDSVLETCRKMLALTVK